MSSDDPVIGTVRGMLLRELGAMQRSVVLYPDDATIWHAVPGQPNAGGTLVLHCCGNLRHYIGARLGGTGYVRDRDGEFSSRGASRQELLALVETTAAEVAATLDRLDPALLDGEYPELMGGHAVLARELLLHLPVHLAFHLGQLDYHRRAATGDPRGVQPVPSSGLPSARPA